MTGSAVDVHSWIDLHLVAKDVIEASSKSPIIVADPQLGPAPKRLSKSLEALNCGAMWSSFVEEIVLEKGERGLGFSILDYQVRFYYSAAHL